MASGIICQVCGIEAPTRNVEFHQNIGMLVMRTRRRIAGQLCKACIHRHFWKMTTTTLFLGPWGTISLVIAPCFILNNVARYLAVLRMPPVPPGATVPVLTQAVANKLQPLTSAMFDRLNLGEKLEAVATDVAAKTGVTPGQVIKYLVAVSQQNKQTPHTGGFPVLPPKSAQAVIPLEPDPSEGEVLEAIPYNDPVIGIPPSPRR
jgi:hypothetical protein